MSTPLTGLIESFFAGHMGMNELAAVAVGVSAFTLLYNFFIFLRKGTIGLTAQARGSENFAEVRACAVRSISMGIHVGAGEVR